MTRSLISLVFSIQTSSYDQPPHFAGPGSDLVQLGVPEESPGGIVVDVTVTTQDLNGVQTDLDNDININISYYIDKFELH